MSTPQYLVYPRQYVAYYLPPSEAPILDGNLNDVAWQQVPFTEPFVDIANHVKPRFETRAKIRWTDDALYVAAQLEEPDVWANVTKHDDVIFHDNDFEVFVDISGSNAYYKETEVNALGVTWDLSLNKPYGDGGGENSSRTLGAHGFDMANMVLPLMARARVRGPINDPAVRNGGWSVELRLPFVGLKLNNTVQNYTPRPGEFWRINFSRVEWHVMNRGGRYVKDPAYPHEDNWVWSQQGEVQMHLPERWGILQLAAGTVNATSVAMLPSWNERAVAMTIYYAQHAVLAKFGRFTNSVKLLAEYAPPRTLDGSCTGAVSVSLVDGAADFCARVPSLDGTREACVRGDRRLSVVSNNEGVCNCFSYDRNM